MTTNFSVVICAYTEARWAELKAAVESVRGQRSPAKEIILVIDHNPRLLDMTRQEFSDLAILPNREARGLSGGRNTGVAAASGRFVAFLDDDAMAEPDWLCHLGEGYKDSSVLGVGGAIEPIWVSQRPRWFPAEFNWVVGCTYQGMHSHAGIVRNFIGCNMSFRREVFKTVGGFRHGIGRVGRAPLGCEETEFCIRVAQTWPGGKLLHEPRAQVLHHVHPSRATWDYFKSRCYSEGLSKVKISRLVGKKDGLASERRYVYRALPEGLLRGMKDAFLGFDPAGLARCGAIVSGVAVTAFGYLAGGMAERREKAAQTEEIRPV